MGLFVWTEEKFPFFSSLHAGTRLPSVGSPILPLRSDAGTGKTRLARTTACRPEYPAISTGGSGRGGDGRAQAAGQSGHPGICPPDPFPPGCLRVPGLPASARKSSLTCPLPIREHGRMSNGVMVPFGSACRAAPERNGFPYVAADTAAETGASEDGLSPDRTASVCHPRAHRRSVPRGLFADRSGTAGHRNDPSGSGASRNHADQHEV